VLDETIIAGGPASEWAHYFLVEMAAAGASLAELRDFCNRTGIPARRKRNWGLSAWNAILQPSSILQFCGYGLWNVRTKEGWERPPSEWVIVPNAHPALITEDEARAIIAARRHAQTTSSIPVNRGRSLSSEYLLSGGLFQCQRCGANMVGFRTSSGEYYVCGSQPYRRGMGCGPGVHVPRRAVETEVNLGLSELFTLWSEPKGLTRQVNAEFRCLWVESGHSDNASARAEVEKIDCKIANIRRAVEDGLADGSWANTRLRDLLVKRGALNKSLHGSEPPQLDTGTVIAYRRQTEKVMASGYPADRKRFIRALVDDIKLDPDSLEVRIS
jgi:Recombinase/Recombinase zinc beta ribbon domain